MRGALATLSVLLGIVALTVSLVVFRKNYGVNTGHEDLSTTLATLDRRIEGLRQQVEEMTHKNAELGQRLARAEEKLAADPASIARQQFDGMVRQAIKEVVQQSLDQRLKEAPAAAAQPQPAPASPTDAAFQKMADDLAAKTGASEDEKRILEALLSAARNQFNSIYQQKELAPEEKERQMAQVRQRLEENIRHMLGEKATKFDGWEKSLDDKYAKRFFGLEVAVP